MTTRRWNSYRPLPLLCAASLVVMLLACVAGAKWSQPTRILASPDMARLAYAQVMVGVSSKSDLDRLGLDAGHGARSLSGLAVQEYFMPRSSRRPAGLNR